MQSAAEMTAPFLFRKVTIKNHKFYINTATDDDYEGGDWITISGVYEFSRGEDGNDTDAQDFDSAGWGSQLTVTRNFTLGLSAHYLVDEENGTRDQGQQLVDQAAHQFGSTGYRWYKMEALNTARTTPIGHIIIQGSTKLTDGGGGIEDISPLNVEILANGQPIGSGIYDVFTVI